MPKKKRTEKDLRTQIQTDNLLEKRERQYVPQVKSAKNRFVEKASRNYEETGRPYTGLMTEEFLSESIIYSLIAVIINKPYRYNTEFG